MSLRSRALLIGLVIGAAVVGIVIALLLNSLFGGGGGLGANESTTPPTSSSPEKRSATATPTSTDTTAPDESSAGIQQAAADFLTTYTSDQDTKAWTQALTPLTTPEMLASLTTSDRDLAGSLAGTRVGDPQSSQVPVLNGGQTVATIHLTQVAQDDSGIITDTTPWQVDYIDFTDPPEETALPLSSTSNREISAAIQPALATILAQPGGLTDEGRRTQITNAFTNADKALDIERTAPADKRVTMGNIHDVQLTTDADGSLIAIVIAPWQIDGDRLVQWTTLTVTLTRGSTGNWVAADATTS